jgi:LPS sulfotransferase NodH
MKLKEKLMDTIKRPKKIVQKVAYGTLKNFGNRDYKNFVVLSRSRTGSTMLVSLLNHHDNIKCYGEILNNGKSIKSIDDIYDKQPTFINALGFKVFYYHGAKEDSFSVWKELLNKDNLFIIHLKRKNILRTIVSRKIANKTDIWNSVECKTDLENKKVTLNPKSVMESIRKTKRMVNWGDNLFHEKDMLEVYYKSLVEKKEKVMENIFAKLNVPESNVHSGTSRQNPEKLNNLIKNYNQVVEYFEETKFEWMLRE